MNDIQKGDVVVIDSDPVRVLSVSHTKMGRQGATVSITMKNLRTGGMRDRTLKPADRFDEAVIKEKTMRFEFAHRGTATFVNPQNPADRLAVGEETVADSLPYLPPKSEVTLLFFNDNLIGVELPPKVDLRVVSAPPGLRGDTAQGGTKQVETETGLIVATPLFINEGDVIRVNTESGLYVERVQKA